MTNQETTLKKPKTEKKLQEVIDLGFGKFLFKSSSKRRYYRTDSKTCTCLDYQLNIKQNHEYICKHIAKIRDLGVAGKSELFEYKADVTQSDLYLDPKFIINIKGNDFVKYAGLLDLLYQKGFKEFYPEIIQMPTEENGQTTIVKATVVGLDDKKYYEYGDANPRNVSGMVKGHEMRIALTRAKARVLRDYTNVGMTCLEEIGGTEEQHQTATEAKNFKDIKKPAEKPKTSNGNGNGKVSEDISIIQNIYLTLIQRNLIPDDVEEAKMSIWNMLNPCSLAELQMISNWIKNNYKRSYSYQDYCDFVAKAKMWGENQRKDQAKKNGNPESPEAQNKLPF